MVGMGVSEPVEMVDVDAGLRLHSMDLASQSVVSGSIFWDGDSTTDGYFYGVVSGNEAITLNALVPSGKVNRLAFMDDDLKTLTYQEDVSFDPDTSFFGLGDASPDVFFDIASDGSDIIMLSDDANEDVLTLDDNGQLYLSGATSNYAISVDGIVNLDGQFLVDGADIGVLTNGSVFYKDSRIVTRFCRYLLFNGICIDWSI